MLFTGQFTNLHQGFEELHEAVGTIGYVLIVLHTGAALFHHFLLKDRVLARMLPVRSSTA